MDTTLEEEAELLAEAAALTTELSELIQRRDKTVEHANEVQGLLCSVTKRKKDMENSVEEISRKRNVLLEKLNKLNVSALKEPPLENEIVKKEPTEKKSWLAYLWEDVLKPWIKKVSIIESVDINFKKPRERHNVEDKDETEIDYVESEIDEAVDSVESLKTATHSDLDPGESLKAAVTQVEELMALTKHEIAEIDKRIEEVTQKYEVLVKQVGEINQKIEAIESRLKAIKKSAGDSPKLANMSSDPGALEEAIDRIDAQEEESEVATRRSR